MRQSIDFSLVLPCYNEELIIAESVERILAVLKLSRLSFELIFIDDKSTDRTVFLLHSICRDKSKMYLLRHRVNCGRGKSIVDGIKRARGKVVGYIDIDLEVSPVYIPMMVQTILSNQADVVIGKRIYRTSFASLSREFFSLGYRLIANWLLNTGGLDTETGYKFFHRQKILPILTDATHPHWFWDTEIMVLSKRAGMRIVEIPVLYIRRFEKQSSVRIFSDIMDYLKNLWYFRRRLGDVV